MKKMNEKLARDELKYDRNHMGIQAIPFTAASKN
jgi:hypothetical protein